MVLEMMMESLFAVVDVFWVAHLGSDAVATVGFTESLLTLLYAIAMGLSISAAATVARRIGEKNPEAAADVAVQSILLGLIAAIMLGLRGRHFRAATLARYGSFTLRDCRRRQLCACDLWRQRHGASAVLDQRGFSRSRRCFALHACPPGLRI